MAHLTGRSIKTVINTVEIVSDDTSQVISINRHEDGSVSLTIRSAYKSNWDTSSQFSVSKADASLLGIALSGNDAQYVTEKVKSIPSASFKVDNPNPEPDPNKPDCTQLDIERAKAENLKEERELLALSNERDHALDKHVGAVIPGCPACERKYIAGDSMRSYTGAAEALANDESDDNEELPF